MDPVHAVLILFLIMLGFLMAPVLGIIVYMLAAAIYMLGAFVYVVSVLLYGFCIGLVYVIGHTFGLGYDKLKEGQRKLWNRIKK